MNNTIKHIKRLIPISVFLFFNLTNAFSQNEIITGTITDKKTRETIVGASVVIQGTTIGAGSDLNGVYKINSVKPGTYSIVVSFISYKKQVVDNVKVVKGKPTELNFELEEDIATIAGVTVTAKKTTDSEISMMSSIKSSDLVVSGISSQQISKSQDRDASEVIKRVPGITIIDNRFVVVRGLSERYNVVWLNNATTPSSESDVKAFSFDVIPSGLIDRMMIYKTPAPELPGDFAGGAIKIFTKDVPEKNNINVAYSASVNGITTFKDFYSPPVNGKYDWLGYDDGSRSLPKDFPDNIVGFQNTADGKAQLVELSKSLNNQWNPVKSKAGIDQRFSFGLGGTLKIGKVKLSNITSINYSNTNSYNDIFRAYYLEYDTINDRADTSWYYNDKQYTNTVKIGGLCNFSLVFGKNQKIEFRNFYNHVGQSKATLREGNDIDNLASMIQANQYSYMERSTYSGQLGGNHPLNTMMNLDWTIGYSFARKNDPVTRRITSVLYKDDPEFPYYNKYFVLLSNFPDPRLAGSVSSELNENIINAGINYDYKIAIKKFVPTLKAGFYYEKKQRTFSSRLLGYVLASGASWQLAFQPIDTIFSDKNINSTRGVFIEEKTNPSDSYDASNTLYAGYIAFNLPVTTRFNIYTGIRIENNQQILNSFSSDYSLRPVKVDKKKTNFFPSINLTYNFTDKALIRAAYGLTINRPEFREIAPYAFYDFEMAATIIGNDTLKDALIHNVDVRFEYYPSPNETFTVGGFYKRFVNPIESIIIPAGSDLNYSFANAQSANSLGLELEFRKSFSFLKNNKTFKFLKDFSLVLNGAYIYSRVVFTKEQSLSNKGKRPMQGQSPYIINAGLQYQNDKIGLQLNVLYNVIGKRIVFVGDINTPDIYEMPHNLLDFTFSQRIYKFISIKGGVQDILNQEIQLKQFINYTKDTDNNGSNDATVKRSQNTMSYKKGPYYTLGITLKF
jgi:outer membrane receptor for ferrienterochelin and colicin